ncbi:ATP-grasp domain-containing protein [Jeotgalibacillus proteolyticus]|uniref:Biotin carboxylase n=1 Tax=Jeotgalibacillus proteolyticus TaxID=2082395 RepID=A0A2S5G7L4_9BACL|nr:ATP-grasp domain-containing protein [Jeotgalibacillus proteolyticus]PPA68945.1 biotin carboxylase [Jeotgalibacillus proteolyticus]
MRTIVFIDSNKSGSSREAIKAAAKLGFYTVLFTPRMRFIENRTDFPDIHQMIYIDIADYQALKNNIKKLGNEGKKIEAIVSFIDPYVHIAAKLGCELGISSFSSKPYEIMENKWLTREHLQGLPVSPDFKTFHQSDSLEWYLSHHKEQFPLIVKSAVSTGSKDVLLVKNKTQLAKAINTLLSKGNNEVLMEEYLEGPQYLIETCIYNGELYIVAVIQQEITFIKRFIVTGYCILANLDPEFLYGIYQTVSSIINTFQLQNGSCHLELRLVNGSWKLIEINPRISGGAMNRMIEIAYGINLAEETIKIALGKKPNLEKKHRKFVYTHYLTSDETGTVIKVTDTKSFSTMPGIQEVFIKLKKGMVVHPPLSMGDRYGYIIAASDSKNEAIRLAKEAAKEITFYIEPI